MKLWVLKEDCGTDWKNREKYWPWSTDHCFGLVVRAETEERARTIANEGGGDEVGKHDVWLDEKLTSCKILQVEGEEDIILMG